MASCPRRRFGAFVDLGGVDGLVHVSELSWKKHRPPLRGSRGWPEVTVEVLGVDMDRERVSLSSRRLGRPVTFARTHQIGQIVPGRVTKLVRSVRSFGWRRASRLGTSPAG